MEEESKRNAMVCAWWEPTCLWS